MAPSGGDRSGLARGGRLVLAHMGGMDEVAVVARPLVVTAVLLWLARRRPPGDAQSRTCRTLPGR